MDSQLEVLKHTFDEALDFVWICDLEGKVLYANKRGLVMGGLTLDDVLGRQWWELEADVAAMTQVDVHRQQVLETGQSIVAQVQYQHNSASQNFEYSISAIRDETGIIGTTFISREITTRRQTEEQLAKLTRLHHVLSRTRQAMFRSDNSQKLSRAVCDSLVRHGQFILVWIGRIQPANESITLEAQRGALRLTAETANLLSEDFLASGFKARVVNVGEYALQRNADTESDVLNSLKNAGITTAARLPIRQQGSVTAVLNVYVEQAGELAPQTLQMLSSLTDDVGFMLDGFDREEALRQSEARLSEAQRVANLGHWAMDIPTQMVYPSAQANLIFGKAADSPPLPYQEVVEHVLTEEQPGFRDALVLAINGGKPVEIDYRIRRSDGEIRWLHARFEVKTEGANTKKRPVWIFGVVQDISERKLAEQALKDSEARWQFALEGAHEGVWDWDLETSQVFFSERWKEMLGYHLDELPNKMKEWDIRLHPDDRRQAYQAITEGIGSPGGEYSSEYRMRCKDGSYKWIADKGKVVEWSAQGLAKRVIGTHTDITGRKVAEQALRASEELRSSILDSTRDAIIAVDESHNIILFNQAAERVFGWQMEEILNRPVDILAEERYRQGYLEYTARLDKTAIEGISRPPPFRARGLRRDGESFPVEVSMTRSMNHDRPMYTSVIRDMTELDQAHQEMRLHGKVFTHATEAICIVDAEQRFASVNPAFETITGYDLGDLIGQTPQYLSANNGELAAKDTLWGSLDETRSWRGELLFKRKSGEIFPVWLSVSAAISRSGRLTHYVILFSDISERKKAVEQIQFLAGHDVLTGLPNRSTLNVLLSQAIHQAHRHSFQVGVLFLDLDRFKTVNDSLGHHIGDRLLQAVAERLKSCLRQSDTVARQGGDEFIAILPDIENADHLADITEHLLEEIGKPYDIQGMELTTTPSIGVSIYPRDGTDIATLVKNADVAMYAAKEAGRRAVCFFNQEMADRARERLALENRLRVALERDELRLHYQPQIDIATGELVGVEALLRWFHPEMGLIAPAKFIPLAEESGLIVSIGTWVIEEACRQSRAWAQAGLPPVPVAVNLSALQFQHQALEVIVASALEQSGLDGSSLEVELTEGMLIDDVAGALRTLNALKSLGVKIAIDDFGTGYSSLSYLKRFPLDKLKIDQSFIQDISTDANDAAITSAIIGLGHHLNLNVVAEGVESVEQVELLRSWGCDGIQGNLIMPSVSAQDIIRHYGVKRPTASLWLNG